jgi:nucleoside-diphosphate-sugar epimerase/choline dehydrogenase-like flavoprotein
MSEPRGPASVPPSRVQVLIVGTGAGGAATAAALASHGHEVVMLEEGPDLDTADIPTNSPDAIARLYRNRGLTPILGRPTVAYVEGCCVGGSTEVNSAFWHRTPDDCYHRWRADALLADFSPTIMAPYFDTLERELSVSYLNADQRPRSSELFRQGIERMGWQYTEVPRCQAHNDGTSAFAPGNKQSMQRTFIPKARAAGAQLLPSCKALRLVHDHGRVTGVLVQYAGAGPDHAAIIQADTVFVCGGAIQTAALLRRSGIARNVGNNLRIHPMIKAAAVFEDEIGAHQEALPIYQVKEFWPNIAIGGSVFSPGFLAMLLADNWTANAPAMRDWNRMALYYAGTRGMNRGTIRVLPGRAGDVVVRYHLSQADQQNISAGLAHLGEILFAAGATAVYPSLRAQPVLRSAEQCRGFLKTPIPIGAMSLSTVHAFSSCPMGENPDLCATDSFGKVHGFRNLFINDGSLIPDSPGVNPQGTIMAIALRNADHFHAERQTALRARPRLSGGSAGSPAVLVTGAPGWLGTRLVEVLRHGLPGVPGLVAPDAPRRVRCLVHPALDPAGLGTPAAELQVVPGDVADPAAVAALCAGAAGAVLFHLAAVIHPARSPAEFARVNVEGTRHLLRAAAAAGVRRIVAVSSNSAFGFNPSADHVFDEAAPYRPYMGYGRSKHEMELLVRQAHAAGELETVIIRPPWFYGPHQPARQTRFFRMVRDGRFPILGDGTQKRSMVYVDNLCQGLLLAAASQRANGEAYWIADTRPYAVNEIVDTVRSILEGEFGMACAARQMRLPAWVADVARVGDAALQAAGLYNQSVHVLGEMGATIACSIDKAARELGYRPAVSLRDGMLESIRWCLANGLQV